MFYHLKGKNVFKHNRWQVIWENFSLLFPRRFSPPVPNAPEKTPTKFSKTRLNNRICMNILKTTPILLRYETFFII